MKDVALINNNFPWLVFSLNKSFFALSCENITTITILPKEIIQPVLTPQYIRGLLDLRGDIIPLMDMRKLFEFPAIDQDRVEIMEILNKGMDDHKTWVTELQRCVKENDEFKLSLDPHKCNFGKWYDTYESRYYMVNSHLKKINQPHCELHAAGAKIVDFMKLPQTSEREKNINYYMESIINDYMPEILTVVKDIEDDWADAQKDMVIVISYNDKKIGLIVDEVKSVEKLEILSQDVNIDMQNIAHYFSRIARSPRSNDVIFLIDETKLGELFSHSEFDVEIQIEDKLVGAAE